MHLILVHGAVRRYSYTYAFVVPGRTYSGAAISPHGVVEWDERAMPDGLGGDRIGGAMETERLALALLKCWSARIDSSRWPACAAVDVGVPQET